MEYKNIIAMRSVAGSKSCVVTRHDTHVQLYNKTDRFYLDLRLTESIVEYLALSPHSHTRIIIYLLILTLTPASVCRVTRSTLYYIVCKYTERHACALTLHLGYQDIWMDGALKIPERP